MLVTAQRSYTINYINSNVLVLRECSATVEEVFELNFTGIYSNFFRALQDYAMNGKQPATISDFKAFALTDNIVVTSTSISRPNNVVTRLNVAFSSPLSSIGLTRFKFTYTLKNLVSNYETSSDYNRVIWNTKWQAPVGYVNTTIMFNWNIPADKIQSSPCAGCTKDTSVARYYMTDLAPTYNYDFFVEGPMEINCPAPLPEKNNKTLYIFLGVGGGVLLFVVVIFLFARLRVERGTLGFSVAYVPISHTSTSYSGDSGYSGSYEYSTSADYGSSDTGGDSGSYQGNDSGGGAD